MRRNTRHKCRAGTYLRGDDETDATQIVIPPLLSGETPEEYDTFRNEECPRKFNTAVTRAP